MNMKKYNTKCSQENKKLSDFLEFLEDRAHGRALSGRRYSPGYAWRVLQMVGELDPC